MHAPPRDLDVARLLAQTDWLRRLARRLAADAASADDLVQDTLVAALARPPESAWTLGDAVSAQSGELALRAWLARVARRLAALGRRGAGRRAAREAAVACEERLPSTADVVERGFVGRAVYDAVLRLDEPYRTCLLLRYAEGLSTAQVAARQGVGAAAARQRLSRGVAMVRARVTRELGAPARGSAALLAFAAGGRSFPALPTLVETLGMGGKAKAAACAAALAAALFLVARTGSAPPSGELLRAERIADPRAHAHVESAPAVALTAPTSGSRDERTALAAPRELARLVVRGAGEGAPLADAEVSDAAPAGFDELRARVAARWEQLGIASRAPRWLALVGEEDVPPDPLVAPTWDAAAMRPAFAPLAETRLGATDAEGALELDALPPAEHALVVRHPSAAPYVVPAACFAALGGDAARVEVRLPQRAELVLRIVDQTGAPVAGGFARVELDPDAFPDAAAPRPLVDGLAWHGPSDGNGVIRVPDLPAETRVWATPLGEHAGEPALARVPASAHAGETAYGTLGNPTPLRVWRVGGVRGRLVWEDGTSAEGMTARLVIGIEPAAGSARVRSQKIGATGEFALVDAAAGPARLCFDLINNGGATGDLIARPVEISAGVELDLGTIVLPALGEIRGRVVTDPHPFEGSGIELDLYQDGRCCSMWGLLEDGNFAIPAPRGDYVLVAKQHLDWSVHEIARFSVASPADQLELRIGAKLGVIAARLPAGMPDSVPVALRAYGAPGRVDPAWTVGTAPSFDGIPVVDGSFRTPPFLAGTYDVEISLGDFGMVRLPRIVVPPGRTADLGTLESDGATLFGRVLDTDGHPVVEARVVLLAPSMRVWGDTTPARRERRVEGADAASELGAAGYRLRALDARRWSAYALADDGRASAVETVDLSPGEERALDFVVNAPCAIAGRLVRGGAPAAGVEVSWSYDGLADLKLSIGAPGRTFSAADGTYLLGPLLPGGYQMHVSDSTTWSRMVDLVPGETERADFELAPRTADVVLTLGGEPLSPDWTVRVVVLDPASPAHGQTARAVRRSETSLAVPLFPCTLLLVAHSMAPRETEQLAVLVDGTRIERDATIAFSEGEVVLSVPPRFLAGRQPRLVLLGWPGVDLEALKTFPGTLPRRAEGNTLRFLGVPPHARLRLELSMETGPTSAVVTGPERVTHVVWPFGDG